MRDTGMTVRAAGTLRTRGVIDPQGALFRGRARRIVTREAAGVTNSRRPATGEHRQLEVHPVYLARRKVCLTGDEGTAVTTPTFDGGMGLPDLKGPLGSVVTAHAALRRKRRGTEAQ